MPLRPAGLTAALPARSLPQTGCRGGTPHPRRGPPGSCGAAGGCPLTHPGPATRGAPTAAAPRLRGRCASQERPLARLLRRQRRTPKGSPRSLPPPRHGHVSAPPPPAGALPPPVPGRCGGAPGAVQPTPSPRGRGSGGTPRRPNGCSRAVPYRPPLRQDHRRRLNVLSHPGQAPPESYCCRLPPPASSSSSRAPPAATAPAAALSPAAPTGEGRERSGAAGRRGTGGGGGAFGGPGSPRPAP